jgi:hypothetical protein
MKGTRGSPTLELEVARARLASMRSTPALIDPESWVWRLRACETRTIAEQVLDLEAKRVVLEIAKRCDRLAELIVLVQAVGGGRITGA